MLMQLLRLIAPSIAFRLQIQQIILNIYHNILVVLIANGHSINDDHVFHLFEQRYSVRILTASEFTGFTFVVFCDNLFGQSFVSWPKNCNSLSGG